MKLSDIYNSSNNDLSVDEFRYLYHKGYVFNANTTPNIFKNYELFFKSLKKDYSKTIASISKFDFSNIIFDKMDEDVRDDVLSLLYENNFVVDKNNYRVIGYSPLFLISSLENNYYRTIEILVNCGKKEFIDVPFFECENKMIEEILVEHGFCLNSKNKALINNGFTFLLASLKNDLSGTIKLLKNMDINIKGATTEQFIDMLELLFFDNDISFLSLPAVMKNFISKELGNYLYMDEYKDNIKNFVREKKLPLTYFSGEVLFASDDLLKCEIKDYDVVDFLYYRMDNYSFGRFEVSDEEFLLGHLGSKYSHCMCVEDVIRKMSSLKLTRDTMSLLEMFAIQLYGAKELSKVNKKIYVNAFAVCRDVDGYGIFDKKSVNLCSNAKNNGVIDMIATLHHEIEHAIQNENIKKGLIEYDRDIVMYYKDQILREIFGKTYYTSNYKALFSEFDADVKAYIKTCNMFNLLNLKYKKDCELIKENAKLVIEHSLSKVNNYQSFERNFGISVYRLNDLFELKMNDLKNNDNSRYLEFINNYSLIKYEYKCEPIFKRKTIEELIEDYVFSKDKKEKGKYFNLLRIRVDSRLEDYISIDENIEDLERIYNSEKYGEEIRIVIDKLFEEYNIDDENKKYKGYYYRINKSK